MDEEINKAIEIANTLHDGNPLFMDLVAFHHLSVGFKNGPKFKSKDELSCALLSNVFLEKMELFELKATIRPPKNPINCMIPLMPSDVFEKKNNPKLLEFRKDFFYHTLKVEDILHFVVTEVLPSSYRVILVHKPGSMQVLKKLNITVNLPMEDDGSIFFVGDYVRAAIAKFNPDEPEKMEITIKVKTSDGRKLGKMSEGDLKDLPVYVKENTQLSSNSYLSYVESHPAFQNVSLFSQLGADMGFDVNRSYSFNRKYNRLRCPEEYSGQMQLLIRRTRDFETTLDTARREFAMGDYMRAFDSCELAIQINPTDARIYELRGLYHQKITEHKKALTDYGIAFSLDPKSASSRGNIAKWLSVASKQYLLKRNFVKAYLCAKYALELDQTNLLASKNIEYLQVKHSETVFACEPLSFLEEKKRLLEELVNPVAGAVMERRSSGARTS